MSSNDSGRPGLVAYSLQVACIAQAAITIPVVLSLGLYTFDSLFSTYLNNLYIFITYLLNGLMAAGIVFIIIVQIKVPVKPYLTLVAEAVKSTLASLMWLWLLLDSIFKAGSRYSWQPPPTDEVRRYLIIRSSLTSILLFVFFYPTLVVAVYAYKQDQRETLDAQEASDEHTPLLRDDA